MWPTQRHHGFHIKYMPSVAWLAGWRCVAWLAGWLALRDWLAGWRCVTGWLAGWRCVTGWLTALMVDHAGNV